MNKEKLLISAILFKYNVPVEEAKIVGTYIEQLENQNEAYENMRKEAIEYIKEHDDNMDLSTNEKQFNNNTINNLLGILNKVGEDNE